jgi:hypothetical protein
VLLCFEIAGEEYCVQINPNEIARLVVGRYDPGGKDPEMPNAMEDSLKIKKNDGIYIFKNVKCRRGCEPGDTDCTHREHVEITVLGNQIAVQTARGATYPVYYGRAETERNVLKGILLTPGQHLYLWISGVRDAAGRQIPLIIRYATPAPEATCQAVCEAWHIIQQLYHRVEKGPLKLTEKDVEDLKHEFNILKGHLDGVITTSPELVKEVKPLEDVIELTALLIKGEIPGEVSTKIVSTRHRLNQVIQRLNCNCEHPTANNS